MAELPKDGPFGEFGFLIDGIEELRQDE